MPWKRTKREFFIRIVLPTILSILLFSIATFEIIIPSFEENILNKKREMIKELTNTAYSILEDFSTIETDSSENLLSVQKEALNRISNLRYGNEGKDYFWITDMHPKMLMHPYRTELDFQDLSNYSDPTGKKLFLEFVKIVEKDGEGYVDYMWQWKDDSTKIVPKLSYVRGFKKWGWIVGTGIYIEDVKEEIADLESKVLWASIIILILLLAMLLIILQQSLKIEKKREEVEKDLIESEGKYRALVEASTEGLLMFLDSRLVYANKTMFRLMGLKEKNNSINEINELLLAEENNSQKYFKELISNNLLSAKYESSIICNKERKLDVILFASEIMFGEKKGFTVIVKDISNQIEINEQLDESKEKFKNLTNNISVGIFRCTLGDQGRIIDINKAAAEIFGYTKKESLYEHQLFDFFTSDEESKIFLKNLNEKKSVKNYTVRINKGDGNSTIISISAVLVDDLKSETIYCDGILEDISEKIKLNEQRENLILELQTSLHFLNQPIKHFVKVKIACDLNTKIREAALLMTKNKYSAILIQNEDTVVGILTDRDIRERAVSDNINLDSPVYKIMTSPLITIEENSLVFEALLLMQDKSTRHLAVKNINGEIEYIINSEEILQAQRNSSSYLLREIENSTTKLDVCDKKQRLPQIINTLVSTGAKSKNITKIVSHTSDLVANKMIQFAIEELGPPPVDFSFIAFGSEGREEQTLVTDQDNGIIYSDDGNSEEVKVYFRNLGRIVCDNLNDCGYVYCKGDNMAKNPKWVKPLGEWKQQFKEWIINSSPQDLIEISIFFDFRSIFGEENLASELRKSVWENVNGKAAFFQHLAHNCLSHKIPINMLGNLVLQSKGEFPETFDIKKAMMPITDFARIYSLRQKVQHTNTLDRISELHKETIITKETFEEINQAYNFLMQLRFKHQTKSIDKNVAANNFINPSELTQIEQKTLKNTFALVSTLQKRLSFDFTGEAL